MNGTFLSVEEGSSSRMRSFSDPRFNRSRLHGANEHLDRKLAGHHSYPHVPKLPPTHPEHFEAEVVNDKQTAWQIIRSMIHLPRNPSKAVLRSPLELKQQQVRVTQERLVPWSVVIVELFITVFFLTFGVISFWRGTWGILDAAFLAWFGEEKWKGIIFLWSIGMTIQVLYVVFGRLFLVRLIYRRAQRPRSWKELFARTFADRASQYVMAWSNISLWKSIWDTWSYVLPSNPWVSLVISHVVGLCLLLVTFSFRSVVVPPLVYVEDSIIQDPTPTRWNLLTKFIEERRRRKMLRPLEKDWEDTAAIL